MKKTTLLLMTVFMAFGYCGWGQTTIDFETEGAGYTPSATEGSGYTDVFNRTNPNIGGNSTYMWSVEDINLSDPYITLDQIDITGAASFTFSIDMIAHHYNDWDNNDELKITYSIDGGAYQNLMWVENAGGTYNQTAALDPNFDGVGDCAYVLPALTTGTSGCTVTSSIFETFLTSSIVVNGTTLDITLQFIGLTSEDEGIYLDNIIINQVGSGGVDNPTSFTSTTSSTTQIDLSWVQNGNSNDVMVAWTSDGNFGTPAGSYTTGDPITGGGTVIYNGGATSYNHTSLTSGTQYYYKAWSVDGTNTYSSGVTEDATTYKDQPSNHVTLFAVGSITATTIPLTWSDNDGTVVADGYIVKASTTDSFSEPVDGTPESDDTDMSDGSGIVNVSHGVEGYTWTGLDPSTTYYFKIWPFTNSGLAIDYKLDGTVPTTNGLTDAPISVFVTRNCDPQNNYTPDRFAEIYNAGSLSIDLTNWTLENIQNNSVAFSWTLSGTIAPGETKICGNVDATGQTITPDFTATWIGTSWNGKGGDGTILKNNGVIVDLAVQSDGTGTFENGQMKRKLTVAYAGAVYNSNEWVFSSVSNAIDVAPGFHGTVWRGIGTNWSTESNWDNEVPTSISDVNIPGVFSSYPDISGNVSTPSVCNNLTIQSGASITIPVDKALTVGGSITNNAGDNGIIVQSSSSGDGSLISLGSVSGNATTQCYTSSGQWHGISPAVSGQTANALYLGGSPNVWMKEYNESTNDYSNVTSLTTPLGNSKGWMVWIETGAPNQTYSFTGTLRDDPITPTESIVRSQPGAGNGFNFVGNPYPSAIDWDAGNGWTKTNLENAIYVYNYDGWATYVGGTGVNGGSRYIAMNQAFFVQVSDDGSTTGALTMTSDVQVHNSVGFLKNGFRDDDFSLVRLELDNGSLTDETVVKLLGEATAGYDSHFDARKMFSFNVEHPQIYSTANGNMSINSLPLATGSVSVDVVGVDGVNMTISATEINEIGQVVLVDEYTGTETDLTKDNYNFTYENSFEDRFTLYFGLVDVREGVNNTSYCNIYGSGGKAHVNLPFDINANIEVYDLCGRKLMELNNCMRSTEFDLPVGRYYVIRVHNNSFSQTELVIIN